VVWLDYADAATMVPMLERLVGGQGGAPVQPAASSTVTATTGGGAAANVGSGLGGGVGSGTIQLPGGRGNAVITRYEGANAVIISAPVDVQRRLAELVRQLDVRQDQVLVEAIIVEISDNVAKQLGVQFLFGGKNVPFAVTNFSNVVPNIIDLAGGLLADNLDSTTTVINGSTVTTTTNSGAGDLLRENAISALGQAQGGYSGGFTNIGNNAALGVLINAVRADSNSNILSTPHITTNNNVAASILFGQEIPVSTGEALSNNFDNAFRTIQRQNVGIELDVTPQINADNEVRLDLRQEVSSIVGPVSNNFNELIINKREIKTTITVVSGEIAVLGGLLDDNERRTIQKIPLLGDIPVLGELFKSRGRSRVKTNLMVFIRPTILRSQADREATTARRYGIIREAQRQYNPKVEPSIDQLVFDYMGAVPPGSAAPGAADTVYGPAQPALPVPPAPPGPVQR
jgi:general secretion pathway protein D